jgi:uncharacterized protein (TIGR02145 family)
MQEKPSHIDSSGVTGGQTVARQIATETSDTLKTPNTLTDNRDGKTYSAVRIGNMFWMAENLNCQTGKSWCYGGDSSNCAKYGRLYDWNTAKTVCPDGWHLPTDEEWDELAHIMGGYRQSVKSDGGEIPVWNGSATKLKAKSGWDEGGDTDKYGFAFLSDDCTDGDECAAPSGGGTDDYGFAALPGGGYDGGFHFAGSHGLWWTDTENSDSAAYLRSMAYNHSYIYRHSVLKTTGGAVRCAMENMTAEKIERMSSYFTDSRDGKKYRAVKIGGMTWMAQNLNCQAVRSGCYKDSISHCDKYGRMYDWDAATKACPSGWHLPTRQEWGALAATVGFETSAEKLKATRGWDGKKTVNYYSNGTDDYGFSALPGGINDGEDNPRYYGIDNSGKWWTATEIDRNGYAYFWGIDYRKSAYEYRRPKNNRLSVRCVMDDK